jgi:hypothetical protein
LATAGNFGGLDDHVATRGVDFVGEQQGDRLLADRFADVEAAQLHGFHGRLQSIGQYRDGIADLD